MGLFTNNPNRFSRDQSEGPVEAVWNGTVIARSAATVVVEGNHFFPPKSVDWDRPMPHEQSSVCPWKGRASYFSVEAGGERNEAAAWTYTTPRLRPARSRTMWRSGAA